MTDTPPNTGARTGRKSITARKWTFLALAFVIFGGSIFALSNLNLLPDASLWGTTKPELSSTQQAQETSGITVLPETIDIPKIQLTASVANPTTTDPNVLDKDLLYGAVRYPGSGTLGANGQNVVIFGHSSYLPIVHNQAYKTFDGIQNLAVGDQIFITGGNTTYVYVVETVAKANTSNAAVPLQVDGNKLTLVTCDSFTTKTDRFVVIAHLVESYPSTT